MRRPARHASFALCLVAAWLWAADASARTERFRWTQANAAGVDNFRIYWGSQSGSYASSQDLGVPAVDAQGNFFHDLVVPDAQTIYVTVSAWSAGLESARSNERTRAGITTPPPPPPPPPPTGAQAAIVGFALWNAQTDTRIDSDFRSGDVIADSVRSCASIEIRTNAYLQASGPGSLKKVFDGQNHSCGAGTPYENQYPYAWEDDAGVGNFNCAASLSQVGQHTLTVTPYDGDNCTGPAGTPVTVTFTVQGPSTPPPPPLGQPGQPYILQ